MYLRETISFTIFLFIRENVPALFTEKRKLHNLIRMSKSPMKMLLVNITCFAYIYVRQIYAKLFNVVETQSV